MGWRVVAAFKEAEEVAGVLGKMRLASMCSVTSAEAAAVADTPELLDRMKRALAQLRESARGEAARAAGPMATPLDAALELRRHLSAHLDLMTQRDMLLHDALQAIRRVDELAAETLRIQRVSVWLIRKDPRRIHCVDLFERSESRHSQGTELRESDYPAYFVALKSERTIAAHNAVRDPRTEEFAAGYLRPQGIEAMLDVPIWSAGEMVGVICCEHVGSARVWNADEETFAYLLSSFVGLALSLDRRPLG
jgi:hypothetical protein